jgi:hypothetical protein
MRSHGLSAVDGELQTEQRQLTAAWAIGGIARIYEDGVAGGNEI